MKNKNKIKTGMTGLRYAPSFFLVVLLALINMQIYGQQSPLMNKGLQSIIKPSSEEGWLNFKEEANINPENIFTEYKNNFGLDADDEMRLSKSFTDNTGMMNYRYQQYYKGAKIKGAEFIVHAREGKAVSANGKLITGLINTLPVTLSEKDALNASLRFVESKKYLWLNSNSENHLRERKKDNKASYYPKGELVWIKKADVKSLTVESLVLCWKFDINVEDGVSKTIYTDAQTGTLVSSAPLDINCNQGTGTTTWNGSYSIWTSTSGSYNILYEDCGSPEFHLYNANNQTDLSNVTEFIDGDNNWNSSSQYSQVQTYVGVLKAFWYYNSAHGRDSYDDDGGDLEMYNNAYFLDPSNNAYPNNASWSQGSEILRVGPGNTSAATDDWNCMDILGHEFTHAVTQYSAELEYQDESGALNESFSDIFGEMVENYVEGSMDWLMGADRDAIRSMSIPNDFNQPDTYMGTNWYSGTADNGGVHTNSGVQNHCFYLLSVGGSGTDDFGRSYSVSGIGAGAAAAIAYRALTVYMTSTDQYIDARKAWIQAAIDLYGGCSNAAIQTGNAWHAVGVESQSVQYINSVCGTAGLIFPQNFQAINTLHGGDGCVNTISTIGNPVTYSSNEQVILHPGFYAQTNSNFVAYIEPCAVTMYSPVVPGNGSDPFVETSAQKLNADVQTGSLLSVTPNPFKDNLSVTAMLNEGETVTVTLYDVVGKQAGETIQKTATAGKNEISVGTSKLSPGVYFITVQSENLKETKKVVKSE